MASEICFIEKLSNHELVVGLHKIKFKKDKIYDACEMGSKQKTLSNIKKKEKEKLDFNL